MSHLDNFSCASLRAQGLQTLDTSTKGLGHYELQNRAIRRDNSSTSSMKTRLMTLHHSIVRGTKPTSQHSITYSKPDIETHQNYEYIQNTKCLGRQSCMHSVYILLSQTLIATVDC